MLRYSGGSEPGQKCAVMIIIHYSLIIINLHTWLICFFSAVLLESMFIEVCTTCSSLHVCIRGCLSCFWTLRFFA